MSRRRFSFTKEQRQLAHERNESLVALVIDGGEKDPPGGLIEFYGPTPEKMVGVAADTLGQLVGRKPRFAVRTTEKAIEQIAMDIAMSGHVERGAEMLKEWLKRRGVVLETKRRKR